MNVNTPAVANAFVVCRMFVRDKNASLNEERARATLLRTVLHVTISRVTAISERHRCLAFRRFVSLASRRDTHLLSLNPVVPAWPSRPQLAPVSEARQRAGEPHDALRQA